jgi:Family of unknown function (DUF6308)
VPDTGGRDYSAQHELLDSLVRGSQRLVAERRLACYFAEPGVDWRGFSGRRFERFALGVPAAEITAADVLALSLLSVERGLGRVAIAVLETRTEDISALLCQIPDDQALHEVTAEERAATLGECSPAWRLSTLLATAGGGHWPVTAYKLMARKRPALFPPFDARVAHVLGVHVSTFDPWDCLWQWFHDDPARLAASTDLRAAVDSIADISLLRCLDVALWHNSCSQDHG